MPALAMAAMARPASRNTATEVRPSRLAMRYSTTVVSSEPQNAAIGSNSSCMTRRPAPRRCRRSRWRRRRAKAPPLETPTSAGSASGLRNRPCMMAPDSASSARDHAGHRDARNPDGPQHELVARQHGRIGHGDVEAERGEEPRQRDAAAPMVVASSATASSAAASTA